MDAVSPVLGGPTLALAVRILDLLDVSSKSLSKSSWLTELDAIPVTSLKPKITNNFCFILIILVMNMQTR